MQVTVRFCVGAESARQACRREPYHHDSVTWHTKSAPHAHHPSLKSTVRQHGNHWMATQPNIVRHGSIPGRLKHPCTEAVAAVDFSHATDVTCDEASWNRSESRNAVQRRVMPLSNKVFHQHASAGHAPVTGTDRRVTAARHRRATGRATADAVRSIQPGHSTSNGKRLGQN